jgi:hypothetical protein
LISHGRGHRFETCHAHQHKRLPGTPLRRQLPADCQQTTEGGHWFVAKLDRSGASLDWAIYLGGNDFDGFRRPCGSTGRVTWTLSGRPPQPISDNPRRLPSHQRWRPGPRHRSTQSPRASAVLLLLRQQRRGGQHRRTAGARPAGQPLHQRHHDVTRLPRYSRGDPADIRRRRHRRHRRQGGPSPLDRSTIRASITAESSFQAGIGLGVPGRPIGPWWRRTGAPGGVRNRTGPDLGSVMGPCWVRDAPGLQGHDRLPVCDRLENQKGLRTSASLGLPRASGSAPTIGRVSLSM